MLFPSVNRLAVPSSDPIDVPVQVQRVTRWSSWPVVLLLHCSCLRSHRTVR
ncbi:hypothetical protein PDIG_86720 [Penicillium digitatum PHI26]|uniref:Uncharacterized protein n=1 Tax=Penicillium digitatum (strain PHI26 / CECT 20796) TaxID=1170229 RepID=K9FUY1_PEND2|nr:hypothetical protein PDIG_86720 [Penicillium digitatum PHI26]